MFIWHSLIPQRTRVVSIQRRRDPILYTTVCMYTTVYQSMALRTHILYISYNNVQEILYFCTNLKTEYLDSKRLT